MGACAECPVWRPYPGVAAALEAPPAALDSGWIDATLYVPTSAALVLAWDPIMGECRVARFTGDGWWSPEAAAELPAGAVTHWQPLPAMPGAAG